jgi:hypothetical protein
MVSDQPAPNLLPAVDNTLGPKDKKIILLVSQQMQKKADGLQNVFKKYNLTTEIIQIQDAYNFSEIQEQLLSCITRYEDKNLILNLTGGTKIMTIAAQSIFEMDKKPMFYVKEQDNSVLILQEGKEKSHIPLDKKLKIQDYLLAYGYKSELSEGILYNYTDFTFELINNIQKYENAVSKINSYIYNMRDKFALTFIREPDDDGITHLLNLCHKFDLLTFDKHQFTFHDEQARRYITGGWLEEHVYGCIQQIGKQKIQDKVLNITIKSLPQSVENELDVVVLANNYLHIIECKTANIGNSKDSDVLYKLNTLKHRLGLKTKSMLVGYRYIDKPYRGKRADDNIKRAGDYGIRVIQHSELRNLKNHLEKWIAESPKST